ncbi:hypothetical protein LAZ67_4001470 [Cordylochernes scorpioides]|uniref:PiggyBac transposable element-derived protein domain-containing protein n=1 Tax=Cordylochernes scorpioides TaxID=51811 RepID=A0ABY6KC51_9ARAC|nr:hypothetical protein LAZ67_4001470 [Cordylochernes scorpioides]
MKDEILNKNFDDDSETENYSLNESSDVSTDEECDSILTTAQMSSSNCFIGKNGYKWNKNHAIIGRTQFRQRISDLTKSTYSNFTSEIEIRAFLGLLYLAGVYKSGHENASDGTGRDIFRSENLKLQSQKNYPCQPKWPLALFYALLDITALNSYIIVNYQIDKKDQKERSTFIVDFGRSLIDEHLATCNLNSLPLELQTTIKKFKNNDGSSTSRGSTMPQESDTPKRCYKCPSKNAGKVKTLCSLCQLSVCKKHFLIICENCK